MEAEDETDALTEVGAGAVDGDVPAASVEPESDVVSASEAAAEASVSEGDSEVLPIRENAPAALSTVNMLAQSSSNPESTGAALAEAVDQPPELDDTQAHLLTGGEAIASPAPRKRLIFIACLMAVTLTAVLVLKTCVVTRDEALVPDMGKETSAAESSALVSSNPKPSKPEPSKPEPSKPKPSNVATSKPVAPKSAASSPGPSASVPSQKPVDKVGAAAVSDQAAGSLASKRAATSEEAPAAPLSESAEAEQELLPMVVEAGLRLLIPAATAKDTELTEAAVTINPSGAAGSVDTKHVEPSTPISGLAADAVAVEVAGQERWQETFLISFSFDSDALDSDVLPELDTVAAMMRENGAAIASITGFTDNLGDSKYNLRLSRKRANAVERYLVDAGIARERLQVEGRGVLSDPVEAPVADIDDPMEPYRIVQIKLLSEG